KDAMAVMKHDVFIRTEPLPPQCRYNGAQRLSYTAIIVMGAIAVLTGLAIYKPTQLNLLTTLFGGYESARTIHFFVTIGFLAFFAIHLLQVARAGWGNFASMITGYQLVEPPVERSGADRPRELSDEQESADA
ncbi:MAG: cytochrome b/b6 domain-containing protein, partial [Acidimicrobiales bacterium]